MLLGAVLVKMHFNWMLTMDSASPTMHPCHQHYKGPGGQEAFQLDVGREGALLRGTSPDAVTAALAWYCTTMCGISLADAMGSGLPSPLPTTNRPLTAVQVEGQGNRQAWQVVDRLSWEGVDGHADDGGMHLVLMQAFLLEEARRSLTHPGWLESSTHV
jgi:hypothetical protein